MNLIVETDIGNDPDDFFALCYLFNAGVNVKAILLSPGHPYQIGLVRFILSRLGIDVPVGVADPDKYKVADYTGFHGRIMELNGFGPSDVHDGRGVDIIEDLFEEDPDISFFAIGPLKNYGEFFRRHPNASIGRFYMQGGFIGYSQHADTSCPRMDKFEGKTTIRTFNLNGDKEAGKLLMGMNVADRRFISKNVNHTMLFDSEKYRQMLAMWEGRTPDPPYQLFLEAAEVYDFQKREKKFHDPTATCCLLHPELANWIEGRLFYHKGEWGTNTSQPGSLITTGLDREMVWDCIMNGV